MYFTYNLDLTLKKFTFELVFDYIYIIQYNR
jgi:hypothetical protein